MSTCYVMTLKNRRCNNYSVGHDITEVRDQSRNLIAVLCESHRKMFRKRKILTSKDGKHFRLKNDGSVELLPFDCEIPDIVTIFPPDVYDYVEKVTLGRPRRHKK